MKRILITGKNSYLGTKVKEYLLQFEGEYEVDELEVQDPEWVKADFEPYDVVYHVAGIAHSDVAETSVTQKELYFKVNCDLAVECAEIAKAAGVKQFIFMSSIIVYGASAQIGQDKIIDLHTRPDPENFYGASKLAAEEGLSTLRTTDFKICIVRPPMIYGPNCRGNYANLRQMALKLRTFPNIKNSRSMLYVGNLCRFIKFYIDNEVNGICYPQNTEYSCTSEITKLIASAHGKKLILTTLFNPLLRILAKGKGKFALLIHKAFGNLTYSMDLQRHSIELIGVRESVIETEKNWM